jgi:S1-C subfamily serine protease
VPPRPGSELAEVGLEPVDRILAVDGALVHTNGEIQRALRGSPIGELMTMPVARAGALQEIRVAPVSEGSI